MNKRNIIVFEHGTLTQCDRQSCEKCPYKQGDNCVSHCKPKYFNELKKYARNTGYSGCGFLFQKNVIEFKKYAGLLQLSDGTYVEILPKITEENQIKKGWEIFQNLVSASFNLTKEYKWNDEFNAQLCKNKTILEIYIRIFCNDLSVILQKGIKKSYVRIEENLSKYKGKLKFQNHIKYNAANAARFYLEYNQFSMDVPENRILKTACLYLLKQTQVQENKKTLLKFLMELDSVSPCINVEKDLQTAALNRLHQYYERPLRFAEFFLRNEIFYPQQGRKKIISLLFPLNEMFEDYIEHILRQYQSEQKEKFDLHSQYPRHYLLMDNQFNTKMDFVIFTKEKNFIFDAKWKKIDLSKKDKNYEAAQDDLYQLFSYAEIIKHNTSNKEVITALLYPKTSSFPHSVKWQYFNGTPLWLIPVDPSLPLSEPKEEHKYLHEFLEGNCMKLDEKTDR